MTGTLLLPPADFLHRLRDSHRHFHGARGDYLFLVNDIPLELPPANPGRSG
jgi:hypothetical protein